MAKFPPHLRLVMQILEMQLFKVTGLWFLLAHLGRVTAERKVVLVAGAHEDQPNG